MAAEPNLTEHPEDGNAPQRHEKLKKLSGGEPRRWKPRLSALMESSEATAKLQWRLFPERYAIHWAEEKAQ